MQRLDEITLKMAEQFMKISQAYLEFAKSKTFPTDLRDLFLDVAELAREGAAELDKMQLDSQAASGRC